MPESRRCESMGEELRRLRSECCTCLKCGHVQAEPNWCHLCGHRTTTPDWAKELLGERDAANKAHRETEDTLEEIRERIEAYWEVAHATSG